MSKEIGPAASVTSNVAIQQVMKTPMNILNYLTCAEKYIQVDDNSAVRFEHPLDENSVRVGYRLVCSGMLYPSHFLGDWSHSDGARILLHLPVVLLVAGRPFDDYPQELVLRFVADQVHETNGRTQYMYYPDEEIASDVAALLTLFCRRLITVSAKVREEHVCMGVPPVLADFPIPAVTTMRMSYWKERPLSVRYGLDGVSVKSYHPPPQPFNSSEIMHVLLTLPKLKAAEAIVRAARLYASAMERIESQPETCYQQFISAAETIAGAALEDWVPERDVRVRSRENLVAWATKTQKLSQGVAERLALEASKDNPWTSRKFKKFLLDNMDHEAIGRKDDLFVVPQELCPKADEIANALGEIYQCRSGASHSGQSYPASASVGPSTTFSLRAFDEVMNEQRPFPPIGWFERVVNTAISRYVRSQVNQLDSRPSEHKEATANVASAAFDKEVAK
jgi:hypothetical protein